METTNRTKIALIHHTDNDGLMCAYLYNLIYGDLIKSGDAELISYNYTKYESWMTNDSFKSFLFADVTPPIDWLNTYQKEIKLNQISVTIFDHHLAKYNEIKENFPEFIDEKIEYVFNQEICGAKILYNDTTCKQFQSDELSILIDFINDYDVWKFPVEDYQGINTEFRTFYADDILALHTYLSQFSEFRRFLIQIENLINICGVNKMNYFLLTLRGFVSNGQIINNKIISDIEHHVKAGYYSELNKCMFFSGYPEYWTFDEIKKKYHDVLYWIGFEINLAKQSVKFNIRSKEKEDCSIIAQRYNGGGHQKASGFTVDLDQGLKLISYPDIIFSEIDHSVFKRSHKNL
jgi:oligoribonuclease NrnB/cAMP/cGMP phosphodiesterase (DHH superfamily)